MFQTDSDPVLSYTKTSAGTVMASTITESGGGGGGNAASPEGTPGTSSRFKRATQLVALLRAQSAECKLVGARRGEGW
ncbi:hypothetical protein ON010_g13708 [Phytophthora cinnamomi]|nr:hypothetical protein ON010_g13708 [Phytophthora cinnamomi]